jgi:hypothetical protein
VLLNVPFFLWNRWFVALIVLVVALIWALIWRFSRGKKRK